MPHLADLVPTSASIRGPRGRGPCVLDHRLPDRLKALGLYLAMQTGSKPAVKKASYVRRRGWTTFQDFHEELLRNFPEMHLTHGCGHASQGLALGHVLKGPFSRVKMPVRNLCDHYRQDLVPDADHLLPVGVAVQRGQRRQ